MFKFYNSSQSSIRQFEPSREDISITKKLVEAGKIVDISVLDHIIFTDEGFTSFVESKII